ncbi:MAG: hypothetical protein WDW38_006705 [Sanguina aurantia]
MGNMASSAGKKMKMPRVPGFSRLEPHTAEDLGPAPDRQAQLAESAADPSLTPQQQHIAGSNPLSSPLASQSMHPHLTEHTQASQHPSQVSPQSPNPSGKRAWSIFNSVNTTPVAARQHNHREETQSPFDRVASGSGSGSGGSKLKLPEMKARPISEDDSPGRVQSYILRDMFQARTALALKGEEQDLASYVQLYGMNEAKIKVMMEHCCLPDVGKVAILGHQFAFARPPAWFRTDLSGQTYKSEPPAFGPPEWQKKIGMAKPVLPVGELDLQEGLNNWKQLLVFEQDEEEREFQARLTTVPLDRLEQQGLALKNMEVSDCNTDAGTGQHFVHLRPANDRSIPVWSQFRPGDCVLIRTTSGHGSTLHHQHHPHPHHHEDHPGRGGRGRGREARGGEGRGRGRRGGRGGRGAAGSSTGMGGHGSSAAAAAAVSDSGSGITGGGGAAAGTAGWMGTVVEVNSQGMRVEMMTAVEGGSEDDEDGEEGGGGRLSQSAADPSHLRRGLGHLRVDKAYNKVCSDRCLAAVEAMGNTMNVSQHAAGPAPSGCFITDILLQPPPPTHSHHRSSNHSASLAAQPSHVNGSVTAAQGSFPAKLKQILERPCFERTNDTQHAAITAAASCRVTLIQGPPGTGKNHDDRQPAEVHQGCRVQGGGPLLACAQSNTAVDNLTEGCHKAGLNVVRIGAPSKVRPCLSETMLDSRMLKVPAVREAEKEMKRLREEIEVLYKRIKKLYSKKLHTPGGKLSAADFARLHETKASKEATKASMKALKPVLAAARVAARKVILEGADVVCATCVSSGGKELDGYSFPVVILDEGSQASEPEALIPIMKGARQVVIVGDVHQLPPTVMSVCAKAGGLDISLFQRLMGLQVPSFLLGVQYRMHPQIAAFSNLHIYGGQLRDGVTASERKPPPGFLCTSEARPFLLVDVDDQESSVKGTGSKSNSGQADLVLRMVQRVLQCGVLAQDVGVVAPYKAQVDLLVTKLEGAGLKVSRGVNDAEAPGGGGLLEVKSVDGYQGREKEVIILSTVRSNEKGGVGFLDDRRRLNVAITRAKRCLVIVGNAHTLSAGSEDWAALVSWLRERGCVVSAAQAFGL